MPDDTEPTAAPTTLLERLQAAGFDTDTARTRITEGAVRLEGETVTDPAALAPKGTRWVFGPK